MTMDLSKRVRDLPSVAEAIAETLEELIVAGRLKGGTVLRQEDLARQFDVSRIPIRDALQLLQRKGLVEPQRRGVRVTPITRQTIIDLYGLREALETYSARQACAKMTPDDLDRLRAIVAEQREALDRADIDAIIRADEAFHQTICEMAGNAAVTEALVTTWGRVNQVRGAARVDNEWGMQWATGAIARHEQIIDAFASGDPDNVEAVIRGILQIGATLLTKKLKSMDWLSERDS